MYELSDRERQIVFYLYSKPNTPASTIAAIFNVSDKTIRNDIKSINTVVNHPLIISNNLGFIINKEHEVLIADIPLTSKKWNDDAKLLAYLMESESCNIYDLADKLSVSETTLLTHVHQLKLLVNKYGLTIERKRNDLKLIGHSYQKRQVFIDRILNDAHTSLDDCQSLQKYFEHINVFKIQKSVHHLINEHNLNITPFYISNLIANLCFVLNFNFNDDNNIIGQINEHLYKIAEKLNAEFNHQTAAKTMAIYELLLSTINVNSLDYLEFEKSLKSITDEIFRSYNIILNMDNLYPLFVRHVYDMVNRCKNNTPIQSDGGLSIKETCFFIYDIAVSIAKQLQIKYSIRITQEEISLISMHIGYLIENSVQQDYNQSLLTIGVIFSSYLDQPPLLERIRSIINYPNEVFAIKPTNTMELNKCDLVVTTNTSDLLSIPHCTISPLFTKSDEMKLSEAIHQCIKHKRKLLLKTLFNVYINPDNFIYEEVHTDKDTVIRKLCHSLEQQGIVDSSFLPSVLVREAIATTDINDMYAIPHAMEFIANQTAMSIYINPKGIKWNEHTVKIVFLTAFNHNNIQNLRLLYDLIIETVSDNTCFSKLIQCKTITEFNKVLFTE